MAGIGQQQDPDVCYARAPRFLIVQDPEFCPEAVVSVGLAGGGESEQLGRVVAQPSPDEDAAGSLRPVLSGEPERDTAIGTLGVSMSGVEGRGRFTWVRDADSSTTDAQVRVTPTILGRRADIVERKTSAFLGYHIRPKLLPLASGRLLVMWALASDTPTNGFTQVALRCTTMGPDGEWDAQTYDPAPVGASLLALAGLGTLYPMGWDAVQFEDTGEIVAWILMQDAVILPRKCVWVMVSRDDGQTWTERARLWGPDPASPGPYDLPFESGAFNDIWQVQSIALEVTNAGRIVAAIATRGSLWTAVSDDRGFSIQAMTLLRNWSASLVYGAGVSMARARNDVILIFLARPTVAAPHYVTEGWMTRNGTDVGLRLNFSDAPSDQWGGVDIAVVQRPDGWLNIYRSVHQDDSFSFGDKLVVNQCLKRDPTLIETWDSFVSVFQDIHTHGITGSAGNMASAVTTWAGFGGVDAVTWRGQIMLAACVVSESAPSTFDNSALMLYRSGFWQPAQERIEGSMFNRTFEPYCTPGNAGWIVAGAGTETISDTCTSGSTVGGYIRLVTGLLSTRAYTDTSLPNGNASIAGQFRVLCRPITGGSTASDQIAWRVRLRNGGYSCWFSVRYQKTVSGASLALADLNSTAGSIKNLVYDGDLFIEVLASIYQSGVNTWSAVAYARAVDPADDPDWVSPYTLLGPVELTEVAAAADSFQWGHMVASVATSDWKSVQIHRMGEESALASPIQWALDDVDSEVVSAPYAYVAMPDRLADSGAYNFPRPGQMTATPQFLHSGVSVSWLGEASRPATFDWPMAWSYPVSGLFDLSSRQREWRSASYPTADDFEILLDAEQGGALPNARFHPTALAVFGRNFPDMRIQFNASNSWGAPSVDLAFGCPGASGLTLNRLAALLSWEAGIAHGIHVGYRRFRLSSAFGSRIFRPHQFASAPWPGQRFYAVAGSVVFPIVDNSEDTLFVEGDPIGWPIANPQELSIFSDRFAIDIEEAMSGVANQTGYRWCKITIPPFETAENVDGRVRAGLIVLGQKVDLSRVVDYGFTVSQIPGASLTVGTSGAQYSARRHAPRLSFAIDGPPDREHAEANEPTNSPDQQRRSDWRRLIDIGRRLEAAGVPAALVFDAARFIGSTSDDGELLVGDPVDLTMVRLATAGDFGHLGFLPATMDFGGQLNGVPRTVAQARRLVMEEDP